MSDMGFPTCAPDAKDKVYCGKCEHLMDGIGFAPSQCYYSENLIDNWKWAKSKFARPPGEINDNNDCAWFEPASTLPKKRSLWGKILRGGKM
jgi:hypothetical protein